MNACGHNGMFTVAYSHIRIHTVRSKARAVKLHGQQITEQK